MKISPITRYQTRLVPNSFRCSIRESPSAEGRTRQTFVQNSPIVHGNTGNAPAAPPGVVATVGHPRRKRARGDIEVSHVQPQRKSQNSGPSFACSHVRKKTKRTDHTFSKGRGQVALDYRRTCGGQPGYSESYAYGNRYAPRVAKGLPSSSAASERWLTDPRPGI